MGGKAVQPGVRGNRARDRRGILEGKGPAGDPRQADGHQYPAALRPRDIHRGLVGQARRPILPAPASLPLAIPPSGPPPPAPAFFPLSSFSHTRSVPPPPAPHA